MLNNLNKNPEIIKQINAENIRPIISILVGLGTMIFPSFFAMFLLFFKYLMLFKIKLIHMHTVIIITAKL
jgi:hypothetical protein